MSDFLYFTKLSLVFTMLPANIFLSLCVCTCTLLNRYIVANRPNGHVMLLTLDMIHTTEFMC